MHGHLLEASENHDRPNVRGQILFGGEFSDQIQKLQLESSYWPSLGGDHRGSEQRIGGGCLGELDGKTLLGRELRLGCSI